MPSSRIVACDQDITRINSTAPESEGIRLRKVEATARGVPASSVAAVPAAAPAVAHQPGGA
jgi:hypothetical protein